MGLQEAGDWGETGGGEKEGEREEEKAENFLSPSERT